MAANWLQNQFITAMSYSIQTSVVGHVYIMAILEVVLSRCLTFSYLFHEFRIPHPIPHPYTDAFHIYYPNFILILFVCILHQSIFDFYVLSMYSFTNFAFFQRFNIMNINLNFNSGEQADTAFKTYRGSRSPKFLVIADFSFFFHNSSSKPSC